MITSHSICPEIGNTDVRSYKKYSFKMTIVYTDGVYSASSYKQHLVQVYEHAQIKGIFNVIRNFDIKQRQWISSVLRFKFINLVRSSYLNPVLAG